MYARFDKHTAGPVDRIAWALCQIIDDDAPMRWTRFRFAAECIAKNAQLMADLNSFSAPQRSYTPLSDQDFAALWYQHGTDSWESKMNYAHAIERAVLDRLGVEVAK